MGINNYILLFLAVIYSKGSISQERPVYEEVSNPNTYSTNVTSNFNNTEKKDTPPPTYQPLQIQQLDINEFNSLSEEQKKLMRAEILRYRENGQADLVRKMMNERFEEYSSNKSSDNPSNENLKELTNESTVADPSSDNSQELSGAQKSILLALENDPTLLKKVEANPELLVDPEFINYVGETYKIDTSELIKEISADQK